MGRRLRRTVAVGALVLAVPGCGSTVAARRSGVGAVSTSPSASSSVPVPDDPCADWPYFQPGSAAPARWQREAVPTGFEPVLLITCAFEERTTPEDGEWSYRVEKRATTGLDAVVAALRATPSPPPSPSPGVSFGCTDELPQEPWFLLIDGSGRVVLPTIPHDRLCHKPVDVGLQKLTYTEASATKVRQQRTPAELATKCSGEWKNEPRLFADSSQTKLATSPTTITGRPTSVCTYTSSAKDPEVGTYTGGTQLSDSDAARIGVLLTAGPGDASAACTPAADYAVVFIDDGSWIYVELGGCERMVLHEGTTYTAPVPDLVKAIQALPLQK